MATPGYYTEGRIDPVTNRNMGGGVFVPTPVDTTLNSATLSGATPLNVPPPAQFNPTTGNLAINNNTTVGNIASDAAYTPPTAATTEKSTLKSGLSNLISKISGQSNDISSIENDTNLLAKKQKATAISTEMDQLDKSFRDQIAEIKKNTVGGVGGSVNSQIGAANDKYQNDRANLALVYKVANEDFQGAQDTVNHKVQALKDQNSQELQAYQLQSSAINNDLTDSEKLQVQSQIQEKQNKAKSMETAYSTALSEAVKNRAPASVLSAIDAASKAPGATEATILTALGSYGGDKAADALKAVQLQNAILQGKELQQKIDGNAPVTGQYAPVINTVSSLVGATKAPAVKKAIADSLAGGDFKGAYANITNAVEDSLTGSNKTKFADTRTDIGVMSGMRDAIKAYTDAGGDMGFLKGTADTIAKKFGQLATDPKFAALAVQLQREFQAYRLGMTGAAFSPAESKEYAAVNPRANASLDLNLATIDGALAQLSNRVTSTVNQRIPGAQDIYNLANPSANKQGSTAPVTSGSLKSGVTFKVVK